MRERERERERCKIRTRVFLGGSLEINIKKQEKNIFIINTSRTITCTPGTIYSPPSYDVRFSSTATE